ncbi:MAG: T9SS type A sorting domain-containing protein [bacterium]
MKNRLLPSGLLAVLLGLSFLFLTELTMAGQPGDSGGKKYDGKTRMEKMRANQVTGIVSPESQAAAWKKLQEMNAPSKGTLNLDWISLGPDNYSGVTWSVMFDNKDATSNTIYAGSANGGVWRSTNLGLTWHQMNAESNIILKVSTLAQTSGGRIYAGTGVTYCNEAPYAGTGLFYSDDGYTFVKSPNTSGHNWYSVAKLAVNPSNRIFAATNSGLHYSDDGVAWTQVREGYCNDVAVGNDGTIITVVAGSVWVAAAGDFNNFVNVSNGLSTGLPFNLNGWTVVAIAPTDPNILYASLADSTGYLLNVYISRDKGANWSVIFPGNETFEPLAGEGCYSHTLTVFPNDPYQILLGGVNMWWGKQIQTTGFFDWMEMSNGSTSTLDFQYAPSRHHNYLFRPGYPTQLAMATDGGVTTAIIGTDYMQYKTSNKNYAVSRFNSVAMSRNKEWAMGGGDAIGTQVIGAYYPALVNNPTDGYQAWWNDGARTADEGGSGGTCAWSTIAPNTIFFSKIGDSLRREDLTDLSYTNGFIMGIVNTKVDITPIEYWESINFTDTRDSVKYINKTGKEIKADTTLVIESSTVSFRFDYITTEPIPAGDSIMIPDPVASRFFVAGTRGGNYSVWMTKGALNFTGTPTWFKIIIIPASDTAFFNDPISTMALSKDLNTLWCGTEGGRMIRISNITMAYDFATADVTSPTCIIATEKFQDLPFLGRYISSIAINPNDSRQVMVTLGNYENNDYVFLTENANDSLPAFNSVQGNLPPIPVFSGLIEMHDNNRAIIGTEYGVFSTSNLTGSAPEWSLELLNMGDVPVTQIKQQTLDHYLIKNLGTIYASTYGRGIFIDTTYYTPLGIDPGNITPVGKNSTIRVTPNPATDKISITYDLEKAGSVTAQVTDLTGRNVITTLFGDKPKGSNISVMDLRSLPAGTYIIRVGNAFGKVVKL